VVAGFMVTTRMTSCHKTSSQTRARAEIHVSLVFERQHITSSSCSECDSQIWCEHVIASVLYRIKHANEVLSTLMSVKCITGQGNPVVM